jgi:hypothetical protein
MPTFCRSLRKTAKLLIEWERVLNSFNFSAHPSSFHLCPRILYRIPSIGRKPRRDWLNVKSGPIAERLLNLEGGKLEARS